MAGVGDMKAKDRPLSEEYRLAALEYVDAEDAANILEETKTSHLEVLKTQLIADSGQMTDATATRLVKSSAPWMKYLREMCEARAKAHKLRHKLEWVRMRHSEWTTTNANYRAEQRL